MLTKEQLLNGQRNTMLCILMKDVERGNSEGLQLAYEQINSNNEILVQQLKKDRDIPFMPQKMIFRDMGLLIYEMAEENHSVISVLQDYYASRYPRIAMIVKSDAQILKGRKKSELEFNSLEDFNRLVYAFLAYREEAFNEDGCLEILYKYTIRTLCTYYISDKYKDGIVLESIRFNTGEPVCESKLFDKWLEKRKNAIAEYLSRKKGSNIDVENLNDELHNIFNANFDDYKEKPWVDVGCYPSMLSRQIITEHHGSATWLDVMTDDKNPKNDASCLGYKPGMTFLIEKYFKNVVYCKVREYQNEYGEDIPRIYLSRELLTDPAEDIVSLCYMYNMDIFSKILEDMVAEYYRNFSWEKISKKAIEARYENIISRLSNQIDILQTRLESAHKSTADIRQQLIETKSAEIIPFERENADLNRRLEQKEEEILSLKRKLKSKDEYIQLLQTPEEEAPEEEVNLEILQQKRYMFVGYDGQTTNELKRIFPNSIFMNTNTFNLGGIKVDAIVMLISTMDHAMYYKINSAAAFEDVPIIKINTKNLNTIYREMYKICA